MGYKILGFLVWQGGKLYVRRRFKGETRKFALAGLAGVVVAIVAGGIVVQRRSAASDSD
jgi:hypothetical protein